MRNELVSNCPLCGDALKEPSRTDTVFSIDCKSCGCFYKMSEQAYEFYFKNDQLDEADKKKLIEFIAKNSDTCILLLTEDIERLTGKKPKY